MRAIYASAASTAETSPRAMRSASARADSCVSVVVSVVVMPFLTSTMSRLATAACTILHGDGAHRLLDHAQGLVNVIAGDAVVGDGADAAVVAAGEEHASFGGGVDERGDIAGLAAGAGDAEEEDVGLDGFRLDGESGDGGQPIGEAFGVGVVFGEAVHHLGEGEDAGGGEDAGLAHATAEQLADAAGFLNEVARAGEDGADGGAEALGEAEHDAIHLGGEPRGGDAESDGGVEEARAIQMNGEAASASGRGQFG